MAGAARPRGTRADVRQGERWSRWQHLKNGVILGLVRALLWLADHTPARLLLGAGRAFGWGFMWLAPALKRRALRRAECCFGRVQARAVVERSFVRMGENLCLSLLLRRSGPRASDFVSLDATSESTLCEAVAAGRGVVFVSAHLGPFELLAARVAELGMSPAVVVRESYDPRLNL